MKKIVLPIVLCTQLFHPIMIASEPNDKKTLGVVALGILVMVCAYKYLSGPTIQPIIIAPLHDTNATPAPTNTTLVATEIIDNPITENSIIIIEEKSENNPTKDSSNTAKNFILDSMDRIADIDITEI